jgi:hypothetical protein
MGDFERPQERWIVMAIFIFGVVLTLGWVCCLGRLRFRAAKGQQSQVLFLGAKKKISQTLFSRS